MNPPSDQRHNVINAAMRVSVSSQMTTSTVATANTRASSVLPVAEPNLGRSNEELAGLEESEMAGVYDASKVGRMFKDQFNISPLEASFARQLNENAHRERADLVFNTMKRENQKRQRKKKLKYLAVVLLVLAISFGVILAVSSLENDFGNENEAVGDDDNQEEEQGGGQGQGQGPPPGVGPDNNVPSDEEESVGVESGLDLEGSI